MSDLVAVFVPIRLAMTMAEATPSPLSERLIASTGSSPLSCLIGSGWPSTLRTRVKQRCQRLLTVDDNGHQKASTLGSSAPKRSEVGVLLEPLSEVLGSHWPHVVAIETVHESQT